MMPDGWRYRYPATAALSLPVRITRPPDITHSSSSPPLLYSPASHAATAGQSHVTQRGTSAARRQQAAAAAHARRCSSERGHHRVQALTYATRCSLYSISIQNSKSLLSPIPQSSAGDDVVFCSSESVGCSISDMTIIASHEHFTVFTLHARVHVALSRHCPPHELVYAAFIAYTTAASGTLSSSPHPPPLLHLVPTPPPPPLTPSPLHDDSSRFSRANGSGRLEPDNASAEAGRPQAAGSPRARQIIVIAAAHVKQVAKCRTLSLPDRCSSSQAPSHCLVQRRQTSCRSDDRSQFHNKQQRAVV